MNRRQAKKELKKKYGKTIPMPRGVNIRNYRNFLEETAKVMAQAIADYIDDLIIKGRGNNGA